MTSKPARVRNHIFSTSLHLNHLKLPGEMWLHHLFPLTRHQLYFMN